MSKTIFLDMDGVLCDFTGSALRLHGINLDVDTQWPAGASYEFYEAFGMTEDECWGPINEAGAAWWATLPLFDWTNPLVALVEDVAARTGRDVGIATSPDRNGFSAQGKTVWIQTHFPRLSRRLHALAA
jgi:hypothetical protein